MAGLGRARKESLENQCPLMHLNRCCGFSLRSKQNARHCTVGMKESKMIRLKKYLCVCFVWRRCGAEDDDSRRVATKSEAPRAKREPPTLTGGYYGRKKQIEASHSNGLTRFDFVTKIDLND
ncbi:hypothetical protein ID12_19430 (plasmid) [Bacillus altitudinis]|nr:hypothetical protein ID12_19430 [Bacillus altitudinis]